MPAWNIEGALCLPSVSNSISLLPLHDLALLSLSSHSPLFLARLSLMGFPLVSTLGCPVLSVSLCLSFRASIFACLLFSITLPPVCPSLLSRRYRAPHSSSNFLGRAIANCILHGLVQGMANPATFISDIH